MIGAAAKTAGLSLCLLVWSAALEARADWRDTVTGLRIGVVGAGNLQAAAGRMKPFADHLENSLRVGVEIITLRNFNAIIAAQSDGRIDIAVHSASSYVDARARCACLEAVAVPKASDGSTQFYGIAVTRKTDGVVGLSDLNGRPVAFGDRSATATYRVPAAILAVEGETPASFFSSTKVYGNHVAALDALLDRQIDAAFTWSSLIGDLADGYSRGPLRRAVMNGHLKMSDIDIAWKSPPIPHGPVTIRSSLPEDLKAELRDRILALSDDDADAYFALEPWFGFGLETPDESGFDEFAQLLGYGGREPEESAVGGEPVKPVEEAADEDAKAAPAVNR